MSISKAMISQAARALSQKAHASMSPEARKARGRKAVQAREARRSDPAAYRRVALAQAGVRVTRNQERAMRFLEIRGKRFLVDFGHENALAEAQYLIGKEAAARDFYDMPERRWNAMLNRLIAKALKPAERSKLGKKAAAAKKARRAKE